MYPTLCFNFSHAKRAACALTSLVIEPPVMPVITETSVLVSPTLTIEESIPSESATARTTLV